MEIVKVINNNVVSSIDENNNEIVVMGRGIAFGRKAGQEIEESKIEKIFRMEEPGHLEQFKQLLKNLPLEYVQISNEIISYAKETLKVELSQNIYLTLTDHISFAISRFQEGMLFSNAVLAEVKRFYPEEFGVGLWGLNLIRQKTGIRLPEDEAASIALHLVTAEFNIKVRDSFAITEVIRFIQQIIWEELQLPKEDTLYKDRLMSDLKFLAYRLLLLPGDTGCRDQEFYEFVKNYCKNEYSLAQKIEKRVEEQFHCLMTEEEVIYLSLNLKRIKDISEKEQKGV